MSPKSSASAIRIALHITCVALYSPKDASSKNIFALKEYFLEARIVDKLCHLAKVLPNVLRLAHPYFLATASRRQIHYRIPHLLQWSHTTRNCTSESGLPSKCTIQHMPEAFRCSFLHLVRTAPGIPLAASSRLAQWEGLR
jgi:hypothetical protein